MNMESKELEKLAEAKKILTQRLEELEIEIRMIRECIKILDEELLKKSFISAEKLIESREKEVIKEVASYEKEYAKITYRDVSGEKSIAKIYIDEKMKRMKIKIEEEIPAEASLIKNFLISGVLEKMKLEDEERVDKGEIKPDEALTYTLKTDGNKLKEIIIDNIDKEERRVRVRNAAKWAFTRLYESIRSGGSDE
ncbi:MAG: hypothetical protein QW743_02790 [Candidatus Methanomethylicia archaeon]